MRITNSPIGTAAQPSQLKLRSENIIVILDPPFVVSIDVMLECKCRVLASKFSKGVGIHTLVMKYLNKQYYEAFSSFYK